MFRLWILVGLASLWALAVRIAAASGGTVAAAAFPRLPVTVSAAEITRLLAATELVRRLPESELLRMVPERSGLHYVGCPNCTSGRQEGQLTWDPLQPRSVFCRYCGHRYPSEKYPADRSRKARNPRGELQEYPYWADANGYRYYFEARREDLAREYLAARTRDLARLYQGTHDPEHARRAALLLDRFAQVFPGWCYHYDYPFRQKELYDGDIPPAQFRPGYRTARWTWWAYSDIPSALVEAYDWIRGSGVLEELSRQRGMDAAARIERDLFRNAATQVLANPEPLTNMSPSCWRSLILLGRVIEEPEYVHEAVRRLRRMVETRFFYDGTWPEGAPSYHLQTVGNLETVLRQLYGYSDPPTYRGTPEEPRFDTLDLAAQLPALQQARTSLERMRFPDGRYVPVHDTWSFQRGAPLERSEPYLLPALGHACLGGGSLAEQSQLHLTWSGGYGHEHADNLSLILFQHGRELLSDLGYTHTRQRAWTLATAAHNTVVIDGRNQGPAKRGEPTDGSLLYYDARDPRVQVAAADGKRGYPGLAETYRRTVVSVEAGSGRRYAIDLFEVEGGSVHDYFLHGNADTEEPEVSPALPEDTTSLLPAGFIWEAARNEAEAHRADKPHYAYGYLHPRRQGAVKAVAAGEGAAVTFRSRTVPGGLRVTLFPEPESRLITGTDPAVRGAGEDDAKLDRHRRPFLMLRHRSRRSVFATVLEAYSQEPFLSGIERLDLPGAALALRVRVGSRTDLIALGASRPVRLPGPGAAEFQGEVGVLSLDLQQQVEHAYVLGEGFWRIGTIEVRTRPALAGGVASVGVGGAVLRGGTQGPPVPGTVVRLLTADGWVYPIVVESVVREGDLLVLGSRHGAGIGVKGDEGPLKLTAYPQREHFGPVRADWMPAASYPPLPHPGGK